MSELYEACPIKRKRSTAAEMAQLKEALYGIVGEQKPMSVRQVFYQAVCRGLIEKSENGYSKVQRAILKMRLDGHLPFSWIADYTRYRRKPQTFDSVEDALEDTAYFYRRSLWSTTPAYVEIWLEKNALLGVIQPVTDRYDVSLMVAIGFSSATFLHSAATELAQMGVPAYIYQFGDHDPSGVAASDFIERSLRNYAPNAEIHYERVAVTSAQIEQYDLPLRPTKTTDSRAKNWEGGSVELDAIAPTTLREIVASCIERHIDPKTIRALELTEQAERNSIREIAKRFGGAA